jgi:hypothetical protein
LEPEAASLYCRHLPVEKCGSDKMSLSKFGAGKRYLVLDAGGKVIDIIFQCMSYKKIWHWTMGMRLKFSYNVFEIV